MELTNFIFKPKNLEIAKMVIECFADEWLGWKDNGFYWDWSTRDLPHGYVKFYAEAEAPMNEYFTECCFDDEPVTSRHLTEHMMIALDQEGFFDAHWLNEEAPEEYENDERVSGLGTDNPKWYSFEDTELSQVVAALSENDSQIMSFYSDRVFVLHKQDDGTSRPEHIPLVNEILKMAHRAIK